MKRILFAGLLALLTHGVGAASAQLSIGIFADLGSTSCNIIAPLGKPTVLYINVVGADTLNPPGISGAEFQVLHTMNIGVDVLVTSTPNPAASIALGDPMLGGCNLAFPSCQSGVSINLYEISVTVLNAAPMMSKFLSIEKIYTPSGPVGYCANINKCDVPIFTTVCVTLGEAWLNSDTNCTVAVAEQTWSEVKSLFH